MSLSFLRAQQPELGGFDVDSIILKCLKLLVSFALVLKPPQKDRGQWEYLRM